MQTEKRTKAGRPQGSKNLKTRRDEALKILENVMSDPDAPVESRTQAAATFLTETRT